MPPQAITASAHATASGRERLDHVSQKKTAAATGAKTARSPNSVMKRAVLNGGNSVKTVTYLTRTIKRYA